MTEKKNIYIPIEWRTDLKRVALIVEPDIRAWGGASFYEGGTSDDGGYVHLRSEDGTGYTITWNWGVVGDMLCIFDSATHRNELYDAPTYRQTKELVDELIARYYDDEAAGYTEGALALRAVLDRLRGFVA